MFYALGHIFTPPAIVRPATAPQKPAIGGGGSQKPVITTSPAASLPAASLPAASPSSATSSQGATVKGNVFEMPAGLPPFLKKAVTVPLSDQSSEFAALKVVAQNIGVPFSHTGPDYALVGTHVPFGKPVPAYEFLWYVGKSYVPGTVNINGSGSITVANQKTQG